MTTVKNLNDRSYKPESNDVYIGRAGHGHDGYFGNPFVLERGMDRGSTIDSFREYAIDRMYHDAEYRSKVAALAGKNLVCFCHPHACHGDVLIELSERENNVMSKHVPTPVIKVALPVCPNCNESITGTVCNICGDNDTENYNWDSVDTSTGGVEMCVICDKYEAIEGGLCKECNDSFQAYVDNDFTNIIPGGEY